MGEAGWEAIERNLEDVAGCRHLLVMSSVPLVNTDLSAIERVAWSRPRPPEPAG